MGKYADEAKAFESFIAPLQEDEVDEEELEPANLGESEEGIEGDEIVKEEDWVVQALRTYKGSEEIEREESYNEDDWGTIMNINLNLGKKTKSLTVFEAARASQTNLKTRKNFRKQVNIANEGIRRIRC